MTATREQVTRWLRDRRAVQTKDGQVLVNVGGALVPVIVEGE